MTTSRPIRFLSVPNFFILAGLLLHSCTALHAADATARVSKPNILLIVGDDMGFADVGFHGCKDIPTPNLDALAASGVRFSNGYVSGPYCSPTRAGLLTGRYQQRFGHEFNPTGAQGLPLTETTIADRLKAAGYITGLVGKWHLGANRRCTLRNAASKNSSVFSAAHTVTSLQVESFAARTKSRNSITQRTLLDAKQPRSSIDTRRRPGFSTSPSTRYIPRCRLRMIGSRNFQTSKTNNAVLTTP